MTAEHIRNGKGRPQHRTMHAMGSGTKKCDIKIQSNLNRFHTKLHKRFVIVIHKIYRAYHSKSPKSKTPNPIRFQFINFAGDIAHYRREVPGRIDDMPIRPKGLATFVLFLINERYTLFFSD